MSNLSVMFIAGEASGDALAAELLQGLKDIAADGKSLFKTVSAFGAGGESLRRAGAQLSVDLTQHAVVGVWEVVKHFKVLKQHFMQLLELSFEKRPQVIILVDYPGFNLRFAKALRKKIRENPVTDWKPKIIQFISPQIWAWHENRVYQIARDIDVILSIFPFEKEWYSKRVPELRVEYVGHPLKDRYKDYNSLIQNKIPEEPYKVLLLPGSREKELGRHLPVIFEAVQLIAKQGRVKFKMVLPNENLIELVKKEMKKLPKFISFDVQIGKLAEALLWADVAIASSGTVTMECAYFRVPTVILYKTSFLTAFLGRLFIKVKCIGMPNLLAGHKKIYPEFIQKDANPDNLSSAAILFLTQPGIYQKTQDALQKMLLTLGEEGACRRAAQKVIDCLQG